MDAQGSGLVKLMVTRGASYSVRVTIILPCIVINKPRVTASYRSFFSIKISYIRSFIEKRTVTRGNSRFFYYGIWQNYGNSPRVTRKVTRDHWKVTLPIKMGARDSRTFQMTVTRASYSARVTLIFPYSVIIHI